MGNNTGYTKLCIIWFDPDKTPENKKYYTELKKTYSKTHYVTTLDEFTTINEKPRKDLKELKERGVEEFRIIVSPGSKFDMISEYIKHDFKIYAVVIFCRVREKYIKLKLEHPKVHYVGDEFEKVKKKIDRWGSQIKNILIKASSIRYRNAEELNDALSNRDKSKFQIHYNIPKRVIRFRMITGLFMNKQTSIPELMKDITPKFESEISYQFDKYTDQLRNVCYLYSAYTEICQTLNYLPSVKQEDKIMPLVILMLSKHANPPPQNQEKITLYRGVKANNLKKMYSIGTKGFWPAFSSTSRDKAEAISFLKGSTTLFEISLDEKDPFPHIDMKREGFTAYPEENEFLLLPFFSYEVTDIVNEEKYTIIKMKQNLEDSIFSYNMLSKDLKNRIESGLNQDFENKYKSYNMDKSMINQMIEVALKKIDKLWNHQGLGLKRHSSNISMRQSED